MRTLPGMRVLAPCDSSELREMLHAVLKDNIPTYIRIGMKGEPIIYESPPKITLGKVSIIKQGDHVVLMSAGNMMSEALKVCDDLAKNGVSAEVVSFHTIKPLDDKYLNDAVKKFKLVVTMEEHGRIGGLGSAIAEWCVSNKKNIRQLIFGTADEFMHEIGSKAYARKKYNLTAEYMADSIMLALKDQ
jgi:transketolase